ncbi:MAG: hypothetical protein WA129_07445 [Acidovorax sp.]
MKTGYTAEDAASFLLEGAIFGRIASLQIACLAELNGALCTSHCIPNPAVKMHNLLLYEPSLR